MFNRIVMKLRGLIGPLVNIPVADNLSTIGPTQDELDRLLVFYSDGRYDESEQLALTLIDRFPDHQFCWKVLGASLNEKSKHDQSLVAIQKSILLAPEDEEAHNNLGNTFKELGRFAEAEASYREAIRLKSDFALAHFNLGIVLSSINLEEAESSYKIAIEIRPDYIEAHNNLANVLQELGRLHEAEMCLNHALKIFPDYALAHFNIANVQRELKNFDQCEASYLRAISLQPDYHDAHHNLGITLRNLDRPDEAETAFTQAIEYKPDYAEAHNNLGILLQELERLDEAEVSYRQAIAVNPDYAEAFNNLGSLLQEQGRVSEANKSYGQAIELKSDYAQAHYNFGTLLQELGRLEDAEGSYKQAIALEPDYADALNNLANTLIELGKLDDAEAKLRQAIALKPDYAEAHGNLGNALKEMGRLDEAAASYTQAIVLKPDYSSARHMLAALSGEVTATAPRDYIEELFDKYATKFETSLVENLGYKIPSVIVEMILKDSKSVLLGTIADLGCGTGLLGLKIKQFCTHLEGVDLSQKMLDEAKEKGVYNKLVKEDILTYLSSASLNFNYFISTDVFIYIGDLSDIFYLIKSRNKVGGKLVFSTEDHDGDGFFLEPSGRYSHSKKYIEDLCKKFRYKLCHFEKIPLRKESNRYITGCLYILKY